MGVLSITPGQEFALHGYLPHGDMVIRDPNPLAGTYDGPRDGYKTSHFIWDRITGGAPLFPDNDGERLSQRARVDLRSREQYARDRAAEAEREQNRARAKRRLHPIAQRVKRARR